MRGIYFGLLIYLVGREVANDLIPEEIEGDTIIIATGKPASELLRKKFAAESRHLQGIAR